MSLRQWPWIRFSSVSHIPLHTSSAEAKFNSSSAVPVSRLLSALRTLQSCGIPQVDWCSHCMARPVCTAPQARMSDDCRGEALLLTSYNVPRTLFLLIPTQKMGGSSWGCAGLPASRLLLVCCLGAASPSTLHEKFIRRLLHCDLRLLNMAYIYAHSLAPQPAHEAAWSCQALSLPPISYVHLSCRHVFPKPLNRDQILASIQ